MKKQILIPFVIVMFSLQGKADEKEISVKSDLREVTVYLNGASLTSKGNFQTGAGPQEIVFENLSPFIDANSIQAKGEGDFTILSVSFRTNFLNNQPKPKELLVLEDAVDRMQIRYDANKNQRWVYETESAFIQANKNISGANVGISAAELEKIANIYRTRLTDLITKIQESQIKEKTLTEELNRIRAQLNEMNSKRNKNTGEVVVSIFAKNAGPSKMTLTYNVANASWSPVYDIRANSNNKEVKLDYRANIIQNTGVDWENVKLTVCTGNPTESGTQPVLSPWWLGFYAPNYQTIKGAYQMAPSMSRMETTAVDDSKTVGGSKDKDLAEADFAWQHTEVSEGQTNISYEISIPYTIGSDNKPHSVSVQSFSIPAEFRYYAAPKLDPDAFLLAQITGWDKYNLLSGNMNIFFEENFVGKAFLDTKSTSDTLDISLGRDKNVVVKRTLLKDFCEKKIIGANKKETRTYEISVRNKKKTEIEIEILDQIPLSKNSEIEVEANETSKAKLDAETGKLSWKIKLAPGEEKKMKVGYTVKFPKDKALSNW